MRRVFIACFLIGCGSSTSTVEGPSAEGPTPTTRPAAACEGEGDIESREPHPTWRSCVRRQAEFTAHYDASGRQTRFEVDRDGSGEPDSVEALTYAASGRLVRDELDSDNDGELEFITTWTYSESGRRLMSEQDHGADGSVDVRLEYVYDADGRLVGERLDSPADGNVDEVFRYDADGERVALEGHTYDADGGSHTVRRDIDGDGITDTCEGPLCHPSGGGSGGFGLGP